MIKLAVEITCMCVCVYYCVVFLTTNMANHSLLATLPVVEIVEEVYLMIVWFRLKWTDKVSGLTLSRSGSWTEID